MFIEFGNTARSVKLIDTRTKINIITLNLARRAGFPIRNGPKFINMISQTGHSRGFYRIVKEVSVKIGSAINTVPIWVIKQVDNELVLKILYIYVSRTTQKADSDGLTISIFLNDSKTIVRFLNTLI